jgi:hypothetical protein
LEKELESWIEQDPSLVNPDLLIVGRQLHVEAGILDLLALDRLGNYWAVIEIKRGNVRRETITQAIDYAACIHGMSNEELQIHVEAYLRSTNQSLSKFLKVNALDKTVFDQANRNLVLYVVGTGRDPHLDRMANFLKTSGSQVNIVTFDTYEDGEGNWTLARDMEALTEEGVFAPTSQPKQAPVNPADAMLEMLIAKAYKNGIGEGFELIYKAASQHGLFPRLYSDSIMYAPIADKRRFLIFTPVTKKNGDYIFSYKPEAFSEFFPVNRVRALSIMGVTSTQKMTLDNARKFVEKLDRLFEVINNNS